MTDELQNSETNKLRLTMNKQDLKKLIINKIKKANAVYVHNSFTEFYFKTSKSDLLHTFREQYKNSNRPENQLSLLEWLKDFNDRATLTDSNNLMFD
jgi:oxalate decarboxylase/phosphoglucose isomerase-like protein (cupin superfamily)